MTTNKMPLLKPSWNVTPQTIVPTIIHNSPNRIVMLSWGLILSKSSNYGTINVRAESFIEKPFFKHFLINQRCLIPADSFYEWGEVNLEGKPERYPFNYYLKDRQLFAFAGIFNEESCALITTTPNKIVARIHNRMPVILKREDEDSWLDPENKDFKKLTNLLQPYPENEMALNIVSKRVNSPRNNDENLIAELKKV